ncbi:hypothetical protein CI238_10631 [Colletotrichum incanum]|uniref:Uncharacterized protein n=1 Tax=Colletotrichum incanum TaxID=1573173 RepID=A0A167BQ37_COLIC|nr:hypothetical protein CI238_10631 [Colletotrichum incanum]OHW98867.1 hypothetical protein CSPAE12_02424 [Colletotrichum incanum]
MTPMSFDTNIRDLLINDSDKGTLRAFNAETSRPMTLATQEDPPSYEVLKLITELARIRSILGAAEPPLKAPDFIPSSSGVAMRNATGGWHLFPLELRELRRRRPILFRVAPWALFPADDYSNDRYRLALAARGSEAGWGVSPRTRFAWCEDLDVEYLGLMGLVWMRKRT